MEEREIIGGETDVGTEDDAEEELKKSLESDLMEEETSKKKYNLKIVRVLSDPRTKVMKSGISRQTYMPAKYRKKANFTKGDEILWYPIKYDVVKMLVCLPKENRDEVEDMMKRVRKIKVLYELDPPSRKLLGNGLITIPKLFCSHYNIEEGIELAWKLIKYEDKHFLAIKKATGRDDEFKLPENMQ